jgi:hypothetical protein
MPSRTDIISLAQRITNIEMRLDDMDARLDEILFAVRSLAAPALAAPAAEDDEAADVASETETAPAAKAAPRRNRKTATE